MKVPNQREMIFSLLQFAVIAPLLWRASMREQNQYFKWGMRITAGAIAFANMGHAGRALQELSARARPTVPFLNVSVQSQPPPRRVIEGELVEPDG